MIENLKKYYYQLREGQYRYFIPEGKKVLVIGPSAQTGHAAPGEKYDYIVLAGSLGELQDIQQFLESLRPWCAKDTRVIIEYYS